MFFDKIKKKASFSRSRIQDVIFLAGIFLFSAVLIIGLFPKTQTEDNASRIYFFYLIGSVPVIAAVYFIIVSFRRKIYASAPDTGSSIRFKIALAFVFVAVIPSLPIILLSNRLINHTMMEMLSERGSRQVDESLAMAHECVQREFSDIEHELAFFGAETPPTPLQRAALRAPFFESKGYGLLLYRVRGRKGGGNTVTPANTATARDRYHAGISRLLDVMPLVRGPKTYSISIGETSIAAGRVSAGDITFVLYRELPVSLFSRIALYEEALSRQTQREFLKHHFQTGLGVFLMLLSILIIVLSIAMSFFLSQSITRPVFELIEAAKHVASGNFNIHLTRRSQDEITLLFNSFNRMVDDLEESRIEMYQTQKLQAWRDMARKLVHEIKNPLTPIRLSAERIQRRYLEKHPDIDNIIRTGTETIIEEVKTLELLVREFSRFARLPEMKAEMQSINRKIKNCVDLFTGDERIAFHLNLDDSIPDLLIDKILMRQAITNLIQNAVESIQGRGDIFIKSELTSFAGEKMVRLNIRDNGVGIKEEHLSSIFEPTFSLKEHGTGLGLAIVEKIILEHRGRIFCRSRFGEGTEFIIELPVPAQEGGDGKDTDRR